MSPPCAVRPPTRTRSGGRLGPDGTAWGGPARRSPSADHVARRPGSLRPRPNARCVALGMPATKHRRNIDRRRVRARTGRRFCTWRTPVEPAEGVARPSGCERSRARVSERHRSGRLSDLGSRTLDYRHHSGPRRPSPDDPGHGAAHRGRNPVNRHFRRLRHGPAEGPDARPHLRRWARAGRLHSRLQSARACARRPGLRRPSGTVRAALPGAQGRGRRAGSSVRSHYPDSRSRNHGRRGGHPVRTGPADRDSRRARFHRRPARAVHRSVQGDVRHARDLRRLDGAGGGPGRGAQVPSVWAGPHDVQRRDCRGSVLPVRPNGHLRRSGRSRRRRVRPSRHPHRRHLPDEVPATPESGAADQGPRRVQPPDAPHHGQPADHAPHLHLLHGPRLHAGAGLGYRGQLREQLPGAAGEPHRDELCDRGVPSHVRGVRCRRQKRLRASIRHQLRDDRHLVHRSRAGAPDPRGLRYPDHPRGRAIRRRGRFPDHPRAGRVHGLDPARKPNQPYGARPLRHS